MTNCTMASMLKAGKSPYIEKPRAKTHVKCKNLDFTLRVGTDGV